MEKATISVTKTYYRRNKTDYITSPKTESSNRKITIPKFLQGEIKEYLDRQYELQEKEYRKKHFDIQYPLLLKTIAEEKELHYYKERFYIRGESYRLCCEWFETEANNDRPYLENGIAEHNE